MTRLSSALKLTDSIRIKTFSINDQKFRVRVPLNNEIEAIATRVGDISNDLIQARLKKMTKALTSEKIDGVEVTKDDVIVDGTSAKETVTSILQMENKIVEYFRMLVPEEGESLENITYEEIESELPLQVQLEIVEKITEAIQPGYKDARKN